MRSFLIGVVVAIYVFGWLAASIALYENCRGLRADSNPLTPFIAGAVWPILYTYAQVYRQLAIAPFHFYCGNERPDHG